MTVQLGDIAFDRASYDEQGDVLYLHVGEPRAAADSFGSPEGHALRYDAEGRLIGFTVVNARWLLDRDGRIEVTLPDGRHLVAERLEDALAAS